MKVQKEDRTVDDQDTTPPNPWTVAIVLVALSGWLQVAEIQNATRSGSTYSDVVVLPFLLLGYRYFFSSIGILPSPLSPTRGS